MNTDEKRDAGRRQTGRDPAQPQANTPQDETEAARRSGQFGADKKPNEKGPEYEEGGQYPGKRPGGK